MPASPTTKPDTGMAHTPGPWRKASGYEQRGKWSGHLCIHKPNGGIIAMLPKGPHTDINEANARLIAAAPELLAALRSAELAVEELCHGQDPANQCWVILAEIRAAISRAEGRQS